MPDCTRHKDEFRYYCGRCGRHLVDTHALNAKIDLQNLYGDKIDFILVCQPCVVQMFPKTRIFEREDCK